MNLREHRNRRREHPELEMTPLIDIVFLLLIFFMITTSFSQANQQNETQIPIDLPESESGSAPSPNQQTILVVQADGSVDIRTESDVSGETLAERLESLYEIAPDAPVLLKGDRDASHGRMVEVLDRAKRAGFRKVNLVTTPKEQ
jgi:biopolymer transport protein ExbD